MRIEVAGGTSEPCSDFVSVAVSPAQERTTPTLVLNLNDVELRAIGDDLHQGVLRITWQREPVPSLPERDPNPGSGIHRPLPGKVPVLVRLLRCLLERDLGLAFRGLLSGRPGLRVTCVGLVFVLHFSTALDDVESDRSMKRSMRARGKSSLRCGGSGDITSRPVGSRCTAADPAASR